MKCLQTLTGEREACQVRDKDVLQPQAHGEKTTQSLWLMDPLVHLGTWEQFVEAAWSARYTRLGIDETRMETELDDQSCAACTGVCQCINTLPGTTEGEVTCCLCQGAGDELRKERELCRPCSQRALHRRRFDLVAMNLDKKSLFILEFKRTSDLDPRYREEALARAEQQYIDEIEGIREVLPEDWKVVPVFIIAGTTSVNVFGDEDNQSPTQKMEGLPRAPHVYFAQRTGQNTKELLGPASRLHPELDPRGLTSHSDLRGSDL